MLQQPARLQMPGPGHALGSVVQPKQPVMLAYAGASGAGQSKMAEARRSARKPKEPQTDVHLPAQQPIASEAHHSANFGRPGPSQHLPGNGQPAQLSHQVHPLAGQAQCGLRPVLLSSSRLCAQTSPAEERALGDVPTWMQRMETAIEQQVSKMSLI